MDSLELFKIDLRGLKQGVNTFEFQVDDNVFEALDTTDIRKGNLAADVRIDRNESIFKVNASIKGEVTIPCDRCLDDMQQPIETEGSLLVTMTKDSHHATAASSDDILADEQMTVSEKDGILDLSWFIYETAALAIPIKHVHAPGKCNSEMMNVIKEHSVTERDGEDCEEQIDPRWSGLLKLKDNKD